MMLEIIGSFLISFIIVWIITKVITQLNPPIPLTTPKGNAWAHIVIDYSQEHDLLWVCFQDETGECWTWPNRDVRMQPNMTLGRAHG